MEKEVWYVVESDVAPGARVWTGYSGQYLTAPKEEGIYTLYEVADADNTMHIRFEWVKEKR